MATVLVVGAGIAGDALAVSLERSGWQVVVAEIAPALRTGGQTVDLRGHAAAVLENLGLLEACRAHLVPQRGVAWVDAGGRRLAAMGVDALGGQGLVSTEELLRSDLARTLHDATGPGTSHRFGETVEALEPVPGGVRAHFRHHAAEVFDLVVGADGAHSRVRSLVLGPEERFMRRLGLTHAWFTVEEDERTPPLDGWFLIHNALGGRVVASRPGHTGQQEAGLTFRPGDHAAHAPARGDRDAQHDLLDRVFAGVGWRADELLSAARTAPDFAMDTFDQVRAPVWHRRRVVLLGDSAWCSSPLSGLGTSLALVGAHTLAGELAEVGAHHGATEQDLAAALDRYAHRMRPHVTAAQRLPPGRVAFAAPRTRLGARGAAAVVRVVASPLLDRPLTRLAAGRAGGAELRSYAPGAAGPAQAPRRARR